MKAFFVGFVLLFFVPFQAMSKEVKTTIGEWSNLSGKIVFSIQEENARKKGVIWVCDNHIVDTNLFMVQKKDLLMLKSLIDETLGELE